MLKPSLVPGPLFGRSVAKQLRRKQWEAHRRSVLEAAANTCAHCGASYASHMICHEVWDYDDQNHIATLSGFDIVCRDCNSVLHFGFSLVLSARKGMDRDERAVAHLMKVNGLTRKQATKLIDDAFGEWIDRSKHKTWAVQIAPELVSKYPVLDSLTL
jgi:hypothetical protein